MPQRRQRSPHNGGEQQPLFMPSSDWQRIEQLPDLRGKVTELALDRETRDDGLAAGRGSGWPYRSGHIVGVSSAWREGGEVRSFYAPVRHPDSSNFDADQVRQWELDHQRAGIRFVYHSADYDCGWGGAEWNLPVPGKIDDVAGMAAIIDENMFEYNLDALARWRGLPGKDTRMLEEAVTALGYPAADARKHIWRCPARHAGPYAEQDAVATLMLAEDLRPELERQNLTSPYQLEADLIPMVIEMRRRGVRVDTDRAEREAQRILKTRDALMAELAGRLGRRSIEIEDVRSPRRLEEWFMQERVPFARTPKSGQGSFQAKWMRKHPHWLPKSVARIEQLTETAEKFLRGFIINYAHRGRLHANINQFRNEEGGTRTSRFSYSDPPLQQMPSRDEELAPLVRECFLPEEGESWGAHDFCYDEETEILTERGWVRFDQLRDERVAQWEDGVVSFVEPTDKYVGKMRERNMVHVTSGGNLVDFCVTEDHRCLVQGWQNCKDRIVLARDLDGVLQRSKLHQCGVLTGTREVPEDLLRLVAALQADAADRPLKYGGKYWVFFLKKQRKIRRLLKLLRSLGIEHIHKRAYKAGQDRIQVVEDSRFREYLDPGKTFRFEAFTSLTPRLRRVFLDELPYWDGRSGSNMYGSTNLKNIEVVQALSTITGGRATIAHFKPILGKKPFATVTLSKRTMSWCTRNTKIEKVKHNGRVYCVTVPSGLIITRRNERVVVSGNSQQEYRLICHYAYLSGCTGAAEAIRAYSEDPETDFHMFVVEITSLERRSAKDTNFAKVYGAGVPKFAEMIGKSVEEAAEIMGIYDDKLPFVKQLMRECERTALRRGYIVLIDGARSHFDLWEPAYRRGLPGDYAGVSYMPEAKMREWATRVGEELGMTVRIKRAFAHKAGNRLIQGSAARQMKTAMRDCWREGLVPLIQLHDELSFSHADHAQGRRVAEIMQAAHSDVLTVPMLVDSEYGPSWGHARKIKDASGAVLYGATWEEAERLRSK
jgi:DNA polymerase I-like protein with 3'-5' exonuclease and polymerase domains